MSEAIITRAMVVNWALAELGIEPRFSDDDSTNLGRQIAIFWPRCLAHCLGLHDWSFARRTVRLDRVAGTPDNGWQASFKLPGDSLGPPLKLTTDPACRQPLRTFDIEGDAVFSNETTIYARIKALTPIETWPGAFTSAFATALAHYLAVPLTQDVDMAAMKKMEAFGRDHEGGAGGLFGRIIAQDRAGQPLGAPQLAHDPLTAGRFGGAWHGRF